MIKILSIILGIIVVVVFVVFLSLYFIDKSAMAGINSFEECALHGYPVMESYPRQCRTPDGRNFVEVIEEEEEEISGDSIRVTSPAPFETIQSPLEVRGEARGNWFWEASFPVSLFDSEDNLLAQIPVQAEGDWMTVDFVPFSGTLEFEAGVVSSGYLIFAKDNPSGLPENAEEVRVPVNFNTPFTEN